MRTPPVLRTLLRQPWSTAAIVLTLALGIAATTTVYAVFNHLVFRPTPGVRAPAELVSVAFQPEGAARTWGSGPTESLALFRSTDTGLQSIGLWSGDGPAPVVVRSRRGATLVQGRVRGAGVPRDARRARARWPPVHVGGNT
ncbi:MAG TPA: hypothetical protein VES67_21860 [Vicinamibacterales bacterium]|nr:hypothetical protein [Vicinamibacterales bacterium]